MAKFEPTSTWEHTDKVDTLRVVVPGFKREHLKVQVDSSRNLRVSGQAGDGRQPFSKDFRVPDGCNLGGIRAKFDSDTETLVITLPKVEKAAAAGGSADKAEPQKAGQQKLTEPPQLMPAADKGAAASDGGAAAGAGAGPGPERRLGMRAPGRAMLVYTVVGVLVLVLAGVCFYLSYELRKATTAGEKKIVMGVPE
ncbi:uncharacterized protein LOC109715617 [Ananas comosus]|uniref:Uncharacterized protein LOC109715617 n=1 Tax=Ananas comosus TaxID=4615 RepID=A0A6P5FK38_ANACO|nr:uncharacterized protein LOC109715617 [Ananas comosus]